MIYAFEDYELDIRRFELRRQGVTIPLEPQVYEVLVYLVQHHDRFVSKDDLIEHVWPERYISESALNNRLMTARRAIGDSGKDQRLIRTIHGRGYRFLGAVRLVDAAEISPSVTAHQPAPPLPRRDLSAAAAVTVARPSDGGRGSVPGADNVGGTASPAFGRERELSYLHAALDTAIAGTRRTLFVAGDAGAGKTTLLRAFSGRLESGVAVRIAQGQCVEHRGSGEAYLPVFDALSRLCRGPDGDAVVALLARHAPSWLVHMPALVGPDELAELHQRTLGATGERMLREMGEAVEALTVERPLVFVLEDLHWSDHATLDLLDWLARRTDVARLLTIATYRPADVRATEHPLDALIHALRIRAQCEVLALPPLSLETVERCLETRFPGRMSPPGLAALVHRRMEGNPLFMSTLVDDWIARGLLTPEDGRLSPGATLEDLAQQVPESLRAIIEQQFGRLSVEDQHILDAASVVGREFPTATLDAATGIPLEEVEARCDTLARRGQFIAPLGTEAWPDGTLVVEYRFLHELYQEVIYGRIPPTRKARLHQQIALRLEEAYAAHVTEHAAELAMHFIQTGDAARSVQYLALAAEAAMHLGGYREAIEHFSAALAIATTRDAVPNRVESLIALYTGLGGAHLATEGCGSVAAIEAYTSALEAAEQLGDRERMANVVYSLAALHEYRADHEKAEALIRRVNLGHLGDDPGMRVPYHALLSCSYFHQGLFADSVDHGGKGLAVFDPRPFDPRYAFMGEDAGNGCREWPSLALWFLGYADQARAGVWAALDLARAPARRYTLAAAQTHAMRVHQLRREAPVVAGLASETVELASRHGFAYHRAVGMILCGWAESHMGMHGRGVVTLRAGLDAHRATGADMDRPYYLTLLAEALQIAGRLEEALAVIEEALAELSAGRPFFYEAEIHRLRGALLLAADRRHAEAAEASFRTALEIARNQHARSLELRAAVSLGRLLLARDAVAEAHPLVAPVYAWFTEGHDTLDLREARALLDQLAAVQ